jgi:hypothetical protein
LTEVKEVWSFGMFKYHFFDDLTLVPNPNKSDTVTDNERIFLNDLKYYAQARALRPWIPITRPDDRPPFIINLNDVCTKCREEFDEFIKLNDKHEIAFLLKEIATRFFENIDREYTHESVLSCLTVKVIKS